MSFPVFLDTCVLYPVTLADLILRIAEAGVFRPHWSADILDELTRNLADIPGVGPESAARRVDAMVAAFPDASVTGYESLVDGMSCHEKDRHVLAAAVHSDCQVIVTFNLKDFPPESLDTHRLEVVSPDDFLLDQVDLYPRAVTTCLRQQCTDSLRPKLTPLSLLSALERCGVPRFAAEVRRKADITSWQSAQRD